MVIGKEMDSCDNLFLLLKSGLWELDQDEDFILKTPIPESDWEQIYEFSKKQSIVGVIYDGVLKLPAALQPPKKLLIQWYSDASALERNNSEMNSVISELTTLFRASGIYPILLKGQSLGYYYVNPLHRQTGDVDLLFLDKDQYFASKKELLNYGGELLEENNYTHDIFYFKGQIIETHRSTLTLSSPIRQRRFKSYFTNSINHLQKLNIGGKEITVLNETIDALYIFLHLIIHLIIGGIGLRQFCDWACFVDKNSERIDWPELDRMINKLGFKRVFRAFCHFEVEYIGLKPDRILSRFYQEDSYDPKTLSIILEEVMATGNFGKYDERETIRPKGYWRGKFYTLKRIVRRSFRLWKLSPSETLWMPITVTYHSFIVQMRRIGVSK